LVLKKVAGKQKYTGPTAAAAFMAQ